CFVHVAWKMGVATNEWLAALGFATFLFVFLVAINCFIYWVDRYAGRVALRKLFEPQRQELLALLASLGDETTSEVSGEYPLRMGTKPCNISRRRGFVVILCTVATLFFSVLAFLMISRFAWLAFWKILDAVPFLTVT